MTPPKVSYIEGKIWWKLIRPSFKERVMGENKSRTISKEVFKLLDLSFRKDLNGGAPCVPKHQERDLGKLRNNLVARNGVKWAQRSFYHIEILLSSQEEEKKNPDGLMWG